MKPFHGDAAYFGASFYKISQSKKKLSSIHYPSSNIMSVCHTFRSSALAQTHSHRETRRAPSLSQLMKFFEVARIEAARLLLVT